MLIDSDTAAVLIRDPKHSIMGTKGSSTHKQSHDDKDKNNPLAGGDAGWMGSSLAGGQPSVPRPGCWWRCWGGQRSGWERGLLRSKLQTTEHLIFTPHTGAGAAGRLRAAVRLSPPKPGESPRGSYAIVGKSSNCRDNATGVTHASTESCGVRLEITHIHIYRACL